VTEEQIGGEKIGERQRGDETDDIGGANLSATANNRRKEGVDLE